MLWPQPDNWQTFEKFCAQFFRRFEGRQRLTRYGGPGEAQFGIDLYDLQATPPHLAVQCKQKYWGKTLTADDIKREVAEAESAPIPITKYIVATTSKRSTALQNSVVELNLRRPPHRKFEVVLYCWEDICDQLASLDLAVAAAMLQGRGMPPEDSALPAAATTSVEVAAGEDLPEVFAEIERLIEAGRIDAATYELGKHPDGDDQETPIVERYGTLRLRAKLEFAKDNYNESGRLFLTAFQLRPDYRPAQINRVLGLELLDREQEALQEAIELAKIDLEPILCVFLIRNSNSPSDIEAYWYRIEAIGKESFDVASTLAFKLLDWDDPDGSLRCIEAAEGLKPESALIPFHRGRLAHHLMLAGSLATRDDQAAAALKYYADAAKKGKAAKEYGLAAQSLILRAKVNGFLGRTGASSGDYRAAVEHATRPAGYAETAIQNLLAAGDYDAAREFLPYLDEHSARAQLHRICIDHHDSDSSDFEHRAAIVLRAKDIAIGSSDVAPDAACHAVEWAIEIENYALARKCVGPNLESEYPFTAWTLKGWIAWEQDEKELASQCATSALGAKLVGSEIEDVFSLARLLYKLERLEDSLPLLESAYRPGVRDECFRMLFNVAGQLERHDTLLRLCDELRLTGSLDGISRRTELRILLRYDPNLAMKRGAEYGEGGDPFAQCVANAVSVTLGKPLIFDQEKWQLPDPQTLDLRDANLVVAPLYKSGRYYEAVSYVFRLFRSHFDSPEAHVGFFFTLNAATDKLPSLHREEVAVDTAVELVDPDTGESRWIVLEEESPDLGRDEYSPQSEAIAVLLGKQPGEVVAVPRQFGLHAKAQQVKAVVHKWEYWASKIIPEFEARFPSSPLMQSIKVVKDGEVDLTELLGVLVDANERTKRLFVEYTRTPHTTVAALARSLGKNYQRTFWAILDQPEAGLWCCTDDDKEYKIAIQTARETKRYVIDTSTLLLMAELEAWEHLSTDVQILVPPTIPAVVESWRAEFEQADEGDGVLYADTDGNPVYQEVPEVAVAKRREMLSRLASFVRDRCEVAGATATAAVPPEEREMYEVVLGQAGADAISIAKETGDVLWTDETLIAMLASEKFGCRRVWTQTALMGLCDSHYFPEDRVRRGIAQLVAWNVRTTRYNWHDILAAGKLSEWDAKAEPLRACLRVFGQSNLSRSVRAEIATKFLLNLPVAGCPLLKRTAVTLSMLTRWGDVGKARKLLELLERNVSLQDDYPDELARQVDYWLEEGGGSFFDGAAD